MPFLSFIFLYDAKQSPDYCICICISISLSYTDIFAHTPSSLVLPQKMFGVCIHPRLGGWFAIRALVVFRDVQAGPELRQTDPVNCVGSREERIELLERFNLRWQDGTYRDIIPAEERYSQQQRDYFWTAPGERIALLRQWGYLTTENESDAQSPELSQG